MVHTTVAFTEVQMYNLLKILTNETLNLTYSTIEHMILHSLEGTATTAQSKTEHFTKRTRAQTPGRLEDSDSSLDSSVGGSGFKHLNVEEETRNLTSCEESDGTTEMAMISESFKRSSCKGAAVSASSTNAPNMTSEGIEISGSTTQDATISEFREQTRAENAIGGPMSKKTKRMKRAAQREVPIREEFF